MLSIPFLFIRIKICFIHWVSSTLPCLPPKTSILPTRPLTQTMEQDTSIHHPPAILQLIQVLQILPARIPFIRLIMHMEPRSPSITLVCFRPTFPVIDSYSRITKSATMDRHQLDSRLRIRMPAFLPRRERSNAARFGTTHLKNHYLVLTNCMSIPMFTYRLAHAK